MQEQFITDARKFIFSAWLCKEHFSNLESAEVNYTPPIHGTKCIFCDNIAYALCCINNEATDEGS